MALSAAGFKVSQLALIFGALGVGIGFGLQNVVNNFVSGLVLMFERPIQPGDLVDAAGTSGAVREIGLRATTIRTSDGADVVVRNGLLLNGNLASRTMFDKSRRIDIPIGVAYGSDPSTVIAVLSAVLSDTPELAERPAPSVMLTGYGEGALNFTISAWMHDISSWGRLRGEILSRVLAALQQTGVSVPSKQLDGNLHTSQDAKHRCLNLARPPVHHRRLTRSHQKSDLRLPCLLEQSMGLTGQIRDERFSAHCLGEEPPLSIADVVGA